jgi:hypothetical protein
VYLHSKELKFRVVAKLNKLGIRINLNCLETFTEWIQNKSIAL